MKLFSILYAAVTLATIAHASSDARKGNARMAKRRSPARHDAHRMLKKRVSRFSGHGHGVALEFHSLQESIIGKHLAMKRAVAAVKPKGKKHRHHRHKHTKSNAARSAKASVFEDCDDDTVATTSPAPADVATNKSAGALTPASPATVAKAAVNFKHHVSSNANAGSSSTSNGDGGGSAPPSSSGSSGGSAANNGAPSNGQTNGQVFSGGIGTFFLQNGVAGACGHVNSDGATVVALPTPMYNNGALCGRSILVTDVDTGKTATATVADECPTCPNPNSLDMSVGLFTQFTTEDKGTFNVKWQLLG